MLASLSRRDGRKKRTLVILTCVSHSSFNILPPINVSREKSNMLFVDRTLRSLICSTSRNMRRDTSFIRVLYAYIYIYLPTLSRFFSRPVETAHLRVVPFYPSFHIRSFRGPRYRCSSYRFKSQEESTEETHNGESRGDDDARQ